MSKKKILIFYLLILVTLLFGCTKRDKTGHYKVYNINSKLSYNMYGLVHSTGTDDYFYSDGIIYKYHNTIEDSEPIVDTVKVSKAYELNPLGFEATRNFLYFIIDWKLYRTDLKTKETIQLFSEVKEPFADVVSGGDGVYIAIDSENEFTFWLEDGEKDWKSLHKIQDLFTKDSRYQNINDYYNYVCSYRYKLILGDDRLGSNRFQINGIFSEKDDKMIYINTRSPDNQFMLKNKLYCLTRDGYYEIGSQDIYPITAISEFKNSRFTWVPGHYVVENDKLYLLVQYAKPPKIVNTNQRDSIFDAIIEVNPIAGDSKVLFKTKSNMPRIVAYEEGIVYLFREYQISAYNLVTGEEEKIADLPERDSLTFDCVSGKIFVYERKSGYYSLVAVVELKN
ncbi:hypothetical protein EDD66_10175 [Mobilisporobacter senegalensis]|uniref:DUF5050 domain-containing protein n=1 Tax=Mobilisporobacter senegalensis TaxID=1329262 RepID=A0A3N1XY27_9FIRM|nr:hypothetical protein [Mobilisporobacter senegalensis]ROR31459.1 hypothetical protein EDD66_10175 [Mobilisporobacter senegalensis]